MKRNEQKKEQSKQNKNEANLVTKESICAVCAVFSFMALLILCTKALVFGELGIAVHAFLTGVFGYFAYPLLLGALYLSITSLFEKRFVKNRKAFSFIALAVFCIACILQIALTWTWFENEGYAKACYLAGEKFPAATPLGWVGGIVVIVIVSVTSKIGALILFSVAALFFGYLTFIQLKDRTKREVTQQTVQTVETATQPIEREIATTQSAEQPFAPVQPIEQTIPNENYGTMPYGAQIQQRPLVRLSEQNEKNEKPNESPNGQAFSPFGTPQTMRDVEENSGIPNGREFLFGSTPAENYQRNLIFDPNARVNQRPSVEPMRQTVQNTYTPSYTDAYQTSVNEEKPSVSPVKIVKDRADEYSQRTYDFSERTNNAYSLNVEEPQPKEEPRTESVETNAYERFERETETLRSFEREIPQVDSFEREERRENFERLEENTDAPVEQGWREYKGLFSPENPNVFGDRTEDRALADDTFSGRRDRDIQPSVLSDTSSGRGFVEDIFNDRNDRVALDETRESERLGRDFFDDNKDDTDSLYTVRDDFSSERRIEEPIEEISRRGVEVECVEKEEPKIVQKEEKTPVAPKAEPAPPKPRIIRPYVRVPLDDFDCRDIEPTANYQEVEETKENIIATLEEFNVSGATIASVTHGPTVARYNVTLPRNIPPKKVVSLDESIALSLRSSGVNIYPNFEDGVVSIEVPNKERQFVQLGCMLAGDTFVNAKPSSLMFAMGKDVGNRKVYGDISKMIHLLVAGSSGSGKSVFLGSLIVSMIYKYSPEELRLILIDPKKTEFVLYNGLPHLMINEIITDVNKAVQSLNWAIGEMNRRYGLFEQMSRAGTYVVNLDDYNANVQKKEDKLPKIVIIIDELADLMLAAKKEIEDRIQNLTQKARAAGIHLIVATQRPSTDVITGVIKSNLSTRIAFAVATDVDSRVILDQSGAQNLLGKGDFLYTMQGINTPVRVQSAFISSGDSQRVVNYIKANNEAYYDEAATAYINNTRSDSSDGFSGGSDEVEAVYIEALKYVILSGSASISMIQRKCSVGYNKAGKIVEWMEDMGYISSFDGAKARKVLITKEEFESKYGAL